MARNIGGIYQFNSSPQFTVKMSTASQPGDQNRLWNLGICLFCGVAKQSIEWGPQVASKRRNTLVPKTLVVVIND